MGRSNIIYGVGIKSSGKYASYLGDNEYSREYVLWKNMLARCYTNKYAKTYSGCTVEDYLLDFQNAAEWFNSQIGFGVPGYQLDKDILNPGNATYSRGVCVFVPRELNTFFTYTKADRGEFPVGVYYKKSNKQFCAAIHEGSKVRHLGYYNDPWEAHEAWAKAKSERRDSWVQAIYDGDVQVDPRVAEALKSWTFKEVE